MSSCFKRLGESLALEKNIQILIVESIITSLSYGMLYVIWQPFVLSLGASMAALGVLNAVLRVVSSLSSPAWGRLSDKIGRKIFMIISNLLRIAALIFCLIANAWYILIPYAIFMGLSASYMQYNPARASLIAESVQREKRATAYSVLMFSSQITSAVIAPIGGILAIILGYKLIFYACIVAEICCIILTKLFIRETIKKRIDIVLKLEKKLVSKIWIMFKPDPRLKGLYIAALADSFAWGLGISILYGMLVKTYEFNTYQLGIMSTVMNLSWATTQIPIGRLADKYGRKLFLMTSELIGITVLLGLLFSRCFEAFAILQIPWGIVIATWVPTMMALLADSVPEEVRGEAIGRLQIFTGILTFPAPYIGGLLYDIWGFNAPILLNLLGAALTLILITLLVHEEI